MSTTGDASRRLVEVLRRLVGGTVLRRLFAVPSSLMIVLPVIAPLLPAPVAAAASAAAFTVSGTITVGSNPKGIAYDPDNGLIYVADYGSDQVSVISPSTNTVVATLNEGATAWGLAYDSALHEMFVSNDFSDQVGIIDTATNQFAGYITVSCSNAVGVLMDSNNGDLYVECNDGNIAVVNPATGSQTALLPIIVGGANGNGANGMALDTATGDLYIPDQLGGDVVVLDTSNNVVVAKIPVSGNPTGSTYDWGTNQVFVSVGGFGYAPQDLMAVIDPTSQAVQKYITVGTAPNGPLYDSQASLIAVADAEGDTVTLVSDATDSVSGSVVVGNLSPTGLALDTGDGAVYVTEQAGDTVVELVPSGVAGIPTAVAGGPYQGAEGAAVGVSGTAGDSDGDTVTTTWSATANSGTDGTCAFADAGALSTSVRCSDQGSYTLTLTANDGVNPPVSSTATLTVTNTPVAVGAITGLPTAPVAINTSVTANATFTDPGTADSHTATIEWGDGATSAATVSETVGKGTGSVTGSHTYATAGVYTVTVTLSDGDNPAGTGSSAYQYVVVYNPAGGFVTGGGTIDSPAGAFPADPTLTGPAHFGFVSKYQVGNSTPVGQTEFEFQAGALTFHSSSYDSGSLVISGPLARYTGTGTVNGSNDSYRFLVEAYDCNVTGNCASSPDGFGIQITDTTTQTLIYDNVVGGSGTLSQADTEPIATGNIMIHQS